MIIENSNLKFKTRYFVNGYGNKIILTCFNV